jgi:DNA-binding beta-propeller fold protein YncE
MQTSRRIRLLVLAVSLVILTLPAVAQVVTATLPAGNTPYSVAVNSATNQMYAVNTCGTDPTCSTNGTVTVINGMNNNTATVNVGVLPYFAAVNSTTNKIYVANQCGNDVTCSSPGTVTVIDGVTNNIITTVTVGFYPHSLAVNATTNKIYVANECTNISCNTPGTVTVINANNSYSTSTIDVGVEPYSVAVNPMTNNIYVANAACFQFQVSACPGAGTVTVINGNNNNTQTVDVGVNAQFLALNPSTNKIYVSNDCGDDLNCASPGTVTVIDGATLNTTTVNVGAYPEDLAVNSATNQIYVANNCGNTSCNTPGTVTVINANNNDSTATVNVAFHPYFLGIDTVADNIYVANTCGNDPHCKSPGTVTVIDGANNSTFPIAVGDEPEALGVNSSTHSIYVPNFPDGTVSVIGGNTKLQLVNVTPCRLVDTRSSGGPIQGGASRNFVVPQLGGCNIPTTAAAYSLNVTVVPPSGGTLGYLTIWPTSETQPVVSTLNSPDGRVKANAAIVPAGVSGAVSVYVSDTTNVILDIDAYFAPSGPSSYQFYPLTPCRIVDTRGGDGGILQAGVERDYTIPGNCNVPSSATAYSFNVTVLPSAGGLDYLTVWPKGETRPVVSTLNDNTGTIVANAAIVPAGSDNATAFYANSNSTNLLLDVNGYFAPAGMGGLSMYPQGPCRVLDTRQNNDPPFMGEKTVNVVGSACAPPSSAAAYIFNATVVPPGPMLFLTLWPDGETQPTVSTLNAEDGFITSNMALVPTNNGSIDAYAAALTQLILDISGYFAP